MLLAVTASIMFAGIPPIQATAAPKLFIAPTTYVPMGSLTTTDIKVQSMTPFDGYDIAVTADTGALSPVSIAVSSALAAPIVLTNCVNGVGTGCSINDGPGVAHLAVASGVGLPSSVHNGVLFTVTWVAVDQVSSVIAIGCQVFAIAGTAVPGVTIHNSVYSPTGTVPASSLPTYTLSAPSSVAVPAGTPPKSVIVTVAGSNGFANDVALSTVTSSSSVTATITPIASCNCVGVAFATLTITTTTSGSFTVTVNGISTPPSQITGSATLTVTA